MRSKNSRALDHDEAAHLAAVKLLPCGCCERPAPSDAHHIVQGDHFTAIPLCHDGCHQGTHGIHGDQAEFRIRHLTEGRILNATIRKLMYGTAREEKRTHRSALSSSKIVPRAA